MKKLFFSFAFLLACGVLPASAEKLVIVCPDGFITSIDIPDRKDFPSEESYKICLQLMTAGACGLDLDYVKDHWDKYELGGL